MCPSPMCPSRVPLRMCPYSCPARTKFPRYVPLPMCPFACAPPHVPLSVCPYSCPARIKFPRYVCLHMCPSSCAPALGPRSDQISTKCDPLLMLMLMLPPITYPTSGGQ